MSERRGEIRCVCSRHPLLAMYGKTDKGKLFIHVRIYKQQRVYGEVWISDGAEVKLRCRECLRIQKIKIVNDRPLLEEEREMMETLDPAPVAAHVDRPARPV